MARGEDGRFLPGESGNPTGRKPGSGIRQHIEQIARAELSKADVGDEGKTFAQKFAEVLTDQALAGCLKSQELLLKRFWPERLELEHSDATDVDERVLRAQQRAGLIPDGDDEPGAA